MPEKPQPAERIDLEAEVASIMAGPLPVPVITEPEPPQIPYAKQHRVPEVLLDLERRVSEAANVDAQQLVMLEGAAAGGRQGGLFEVRSGRAEERVVGYLVAYVDGAGRLHLAPKVTRTGAETRWDDVRSSIGVIARAVAALEDERVTEEIEQVLERFGICANDTNGDGDCAACANNPNAPCRGAP